VPFRSQTNLRADPGDVAVVERLHAALGLALPLIPNTTSSGGDRSALWLGPDEWLIVGPEDRQALIEGTLRSAFGDAPGAATDVSANRTVVELRGQLAGDVLAMGCPIDLDPRAFGPGRCAQTLLAKAQVIVHQVDDTPVFDVYVRSSFAGYLADWLLDAVAGELAIKPDR
jgi:sarcosine oxidase subunit gamma